MADVINLSDRHPVELFEQVAGDRLALFKVKHHPAGAVELTFWADQWGSKFQLTPRQKADLIRELT